MRNKDAKTICLAGAVSLLFFTVVASAQTGAAAQATGKVSKGMTGLTPGQPPDLIAQMDADKDEKVTKKEWLAWGRPEKLFEKYDKNSDGAISSDEKSTGMPSFELTDIDGDGKVTADEFPGPEAMVKQFDKNGDGYLTEDELSSPPAGGGGGGNGGSPEGQGGAAPGAAGGAPASPAGMQMK